MIFQDRISQELKENAKILFLYLLFIKYLLYLLDIEYLRYFWPKKEKV